ncbi:MAG: hypothetical protein CL916_08735 [Deltaproteobacteria bacterium]|nr:hypothetical protein [Deltaproteobacteria bacterium]
MNLDEIIQRDNHIRKMYKDHILFDNIRSERDLKIYLISNSSELLPDYTYVVDDEWFVIDGKSQYGKGDLLFTDGTGHFAVVEIKYLTPYSGATARKKRNKGKNKVEEQVYKYVYEYRNKHPEIVTIEG